jgi:hypothetical protein
MLLREYGINPIQEEHATKPDFLKKGGKIRQKQKQKQKQVVNIKNVINIEKKVRRSAKTKSKPAPAPAPAPAPVQLPQYSTYNKFFQPSPEQNYKSISMGNNIPNADNINAISNRVSNLILGRINNSINNANSGLVIPTNFSSERTLTISNNRQSPIVEEVEEKKTPDVEMNIRRPDEYNLEIDTTDLERMGNNYINYPENQNDRLTKGIIKQEDENEIYEDELPPYSASSEAIQASDDPIADKARLQKTKIRDLYKEARQLDIKYSMRTPDKRIKLKKDELIAEILNKRFGSPSFDLSTD